MTVVALAVLAILAALTAQHARRVLIEHRQSRQEIVRLQGEKLAEAGLDLASAMRLKDPAWPGITWKLPAGAIHKTNTAEIVIRIQEETCTVIARYPANTEIPIQVTRTRKLTP